MGAGLWLFLVCGGSRDVVVLCCAFFNSIRDVFNISKHILVLADRLHFHMTNNSTTNIKYHIEILSKYSSDGVDTSDGGDENLNL